MKPDSKTERAWLAVATVCDCNMVSVGLFDGADMSDEVWEAHDNGTAFDGVDPIHEFTVSGADWRRAAGKAAMGMARRTGLPIRDRYHYTPEVHLSDLTDPDGSQRQAIGIELSAMLAMLGDALVHASKRRRRKTMK